MQAEIEEVAFVPAARAGRQLGDRAVVVFSETECAVVVEKIVSVVALPRRWKDYLLE
jgi:hypothetical protein